MQQAKAMEAPMSDRAQAAMTSLTDKQESAKCVGKSAVSFWKTMDRKGMAPCHPIESLLVAIDNAVNDIGPAVIDLIEECKKCEFTMSQPGNT